MNQDTQDTYLQNSFGYFRPKIDLIAGICEKNKPGLKVMVEIFQRIAEGVILLIYCLMISIWLVFIRGSKRSLQKTSRKELHEKGVNPDMPVAQKVAD